MLQAFRDSGVGDLQPSITHELLITPDDWAQQYGLRHGAAFGLAHGLDQLSVFRCGVKVVRYSIEWGEALLGWRTGPVVGVQVQWSEARQGVDS